MLSALVESVRCHSRRFLSISIPSITPDRPFLIQQSTLSDLDFWNPPPLDSESPAKRINFYRHVKRSKKIPIEERVAPLRDVFDFSLDEAPSRETLTHELLCRLLSLNDPEQSEALHWYANHLTELLRGPQVHFRGIVEISNQCMKNCHYCGIRADMPESELSRYVMTKDEILEAAVWSDKNEYGSIMLQSGEVDTVSRLYWVLDVIRSIREETSLGVALSLGEMDKDSYQALFDAGAHRYLLRIESSSPELYAQLHPGDGHHTWDRRHQCLLDLQEVGFQVGTGVMVNLPGQSVSTLADDLLYFAEMDVDMIGLGPYIVEERTPTGETWLEHNPDILTDETLAEQYNEKLMNLCCHMLSCTRMLIPDGNLASTTAMQVMSPVGREMGLVSGSNIVMPIITPTQYREFYQLYQDKPCIDDNKEHCRACLSGRVTSIGKEVMWNEWGDPLSYARRMGFPDEE